MQDKDRDSGESVQQINQSNFPFEGILTTLEGAKKWKPDREELNKVNSHQI